MPRIAITIAFTAIACRSTLPRRDDPAPEPVVDDPRVPCPRPHIMHRFHTTEYVGPWADRGLPPHEGVDFDRHGGDKVFAIDDGIVVVADQHFEVGKSVWVEHDGVLRGTAIYAHLIVVNVHEHERVHRGQLLGRIDASISDSWIPHLHFEIFDHSGDRDPEDFTYACKGSDSPGTLLWPVECLCGRPAPKLR
ncbi:MAG TPA: M23 family metallopeptidase [Acidimicrobiia bacterium]|jgi:murein DD-endopeptidase MepM/ murein hydrolase activator NlpD|nr:M23 family metallopeptidase [Acidimicrobiia bacterium]